MKPLRFYNINWPLKMYFPRQIDFKEKRFSLYSNRGKFLGHFSFNDPNIRIMEPTGFTDIEGTHIYQYDIVETCPTWPHDSDACAIRPDFKPFIPQRYLIDRYQGDWSLVFSHEHCQSMTFKKRRLSDSPGCLSTYVKIIGNKFENPDLIKGMDEFNKIEERLRVDGGE